MAEKLALSVREAAVLSGLGINRLYGLIKSGEIEAVRVGFRRVLITRRALESYLERASQGGAA